MSTLLCAALICLTAPPVLAGPVSVDGADFIDPDGEPVILRGLNVAQSSKRPPYLPWQTRQDIATMANWGCNCVRMLIIWAAIEPRPGQYDVDYLAAMRQRLDWAHEAGLWVILDMHQDLYGEKFGGDGAPEWATVDGGLAYNPDRSLSWAAGYFEPAVIMAFENLWTDVPAPDGKGLQDHFVAAWTHVAEVLGSHPAVIGYDLLNEPFYGNAFAYPEALAALGELSEVLPEGANAMVLFSPARTEGAAELLRDPERYFAAIDLGDDFFARFERERLLPFYERVVAAIREVTPDAIFFLEPHIAAASGANSFLQRTEGLANVQLAYAPHFYDPGCAPGTPYDGNPERARLAFERMQQVSERLSAPVLLGEWGDAESPAETAQQYLRDQGRLLRQFGFSHCYWQYGPELTAREGFPALLEALSEDAP
ncbi:MAG: cellulase family glycosylhydrolase [Armatimonadota bacterium]|nr:cellulase family glycosylhydrolase [Armatimonadota bacterium]